MTTVTASNILEGQLIGDWLVKQVGGKPCNVVELQGTVGASVAHGLTFSPIKGMEGNIEF